STCWSSWPGARAGPSSASGGPRIPRMTRMEGKWRFFIPSVLSVLAVVVFGFRAYGLAPGHLPGNQRIEQQLSDVIEQERHHRERERRHEILIVQDERNLQRLLARRECHRNLPTSIEA